MHPKDEPRAPAESTAPDTAPREAVRMYVHEPGWRVEVKRGSDRVFCHMMAPGADYYHRLTDGEIYLFQDAERLCLSCAARRGVISYEARRLPDESPKFLGRSGEPPVFLLASDDRE